MTCRVCGSDQLRTVLDLGDMPLANDLGNMTERFPLSLAFCEHCAVLQVPESVPPERLFPDDYAYHSSVNAPYVRQCHAMVDRLVDRLGLGPSDLVAEIGSNDGYLLSRYVERGVNVRGFEPARHLAEIAESKGVRTDVEFFSRYIGAWHHGTAQIVHANNVLAHVPEVIDVLRGINTLLVPGGMALVETPYAAHLVSGVQFDTLYLEHAFLWTLTAFARVCRTAGLTVCDVERLASHCGSLRLTLRRSGEGVPSKAVGDLMAEERHRGMDTFAYYEDFADRVAKVTRTLRSVLVELHDKGDRIVAYGAAAKGTVLLNVLDLPEGTIEYVVDATPYKQGKTMPGVGVPIVPPAHFDADDPDVVLILSHNWASEIMRQHDDFLGHWLIPLPWPRDGRMEAEIMKGSKSAYTTSDWIPA